MKQIRYNFGRFMPKTHIYKVDFCFLVAKLFVETQGFLTVSNSVKSYFINLLYILIGII